LADPRREGVDGITAMKSTYFYSLLSKRSAALCVGQAHFIYETRNYNTMLSIAKYILFALASRARSHRKAYETKFAEYLKGGTSVISFGAGRMALYSILEAFDIGAGDEVILPAFTCEVVVLALKYRGIRPIYVDIEPYTFNIDCNLIERNISPQTKAIIAQHTFGIPCDLRRIKAIATKHDLKVIEDCALALGTSYGGSPVGIIGDAAIFSTDMTKVTSTVLGGMAVTKEASVAQKLRDISTKCKEPNCIDVWKLIFESAFAKVILNPFLYPYGKYILSALRRLRLSFDYIEDRKSLKPPRGYLYLMSDYQCFLGLAQLRALEGNIRRRLESVRKYANILNRKGIVLGWQHVGAGPPRLRFSILVRDRDKIERRARGTVEVGKWFNSPVQGWDEKFEKVDYSPGQCPVAELVCSHVINLPTHQTSEHIQRALCEFVESIEPTDVLLPAEIISTVDAQRGAFRKSISVF
jgi:perosamine synthetase